MTGRALGLGAVLLVAGGSVAAQWFPYHCPYGTPRPIVVVPWFDPLFYAGCAVAGVGVMTLARHAPS
jgi:hypothetical protein